MDHGSQESRASGPTRRGVLTALGGTVVGSGCLRLTNSDEAQLDTETGSSTTEPPLTRNTVTVSSNPIRGRFPEYGYDPQNTGSVSEFTGPTGRVEPAWEGPNAGVSVPAVEGADIYYGTADGHLVAMREGRIRWQAFLGRDHQVGSSPVITDNVVVIGGTDGHIQAYSTHDGSEQWRSQQFYPDGADFPPMIPSHPTVTDGMIIMAGAGGQVRGINLETGALLFSFRGHGYGLHPAVDGELGVVGGGLDDPEHYEYGIKAFSTRDGQLQWRFGEKKRFNENAPTIVGDRVYVVSIAGILSCLDRTDGSVIWETSLDAEVKAQSPSVRNGTVYVGDFSGELYAVNTDDGGIRWTHSFQHPIRCPPVVTDEAVFVSDVSGDVRAIQPDDGRPRWSYQHGAGVAAGIAVVENAVVVPTIDHGTVVLRERE